MLLDELRMRMVMVGKRKKKVTKGISEVSGKTGCKTMKLFTQIILDLLLPSMLCNKKPTQNTEK